MDEKIKVMTVAAFSMLIESVADHESSLIVGFLTIIFMIVKIITAINKNRIAKAEAKLKELELKKLEDKQ